MNNLLTVQIKPVQWYMPIIQVDTRNSYFQVDMGHCHKFDPDTRHSNPITYTLRSNYESLEVPFSDPIGYEFGCPIPLIGHAIGYEVDMKC